MKYTKKTERLQFLYRKKHCRTTIHDLSAIATRQNGKQREKNGAPTGTRTQDPMIKSHLLYQLSYGRISYFRDVITLHHFRKIASRVLHFFLKYLFFSFLTHEKEESQTRKRDLSQSPKRKIEEDFRKHLAKQRRKRHSREASFRPEDGVVTRFTAFPISARISRSRIFRFSGSVERAMFRPAFALS